MRPDPHHDHQLGDYISAHDDDTCIGNRLIEFIQSYNTIGDKEQACSNENLPIGWRIAFPKTFSGCSDHTYYSYDVHNHRDLKGSQVGIDHVEGESRNKIYGQIDKKGFYEIYIQYRPGSFLRYFETYDIAYLCKQKSSNSIDKKMIPQK